MFTLQVKIYSVLVLYNSRGELQKTTMHLSNSVLLSSHRSRRWLDNKTILVQCLVLTEQDVFRDRFTAVYRPVSEPHVLHPEGAPRIQPGGGGMVKNVRRYFVIEYHNNKIV